MWPNEGQGGFSTQWALNPSAYHNMANDEVDWAQLAQQWIKMKETYPPEQVPPAPPPPPMKPDNADIEGGEAPMEMDTKDDDGTIITAPPPPNVSHDAASWNSWNNWQQWGWNWQQPGAVTGGGAPAAAAATVMTAPAAPHISSFPPADALAAAHAPPAPSFSYNHTAPAATPEQFNQNVSRPLDKEIEEISMPDLPPITVTDCIHSQSILRPGPKTILYNQKSRRNSTAGKPKGELEENRTEHKRPPRHTPPDDDSTLFSATLQ
ncbi:hypothetical protein LSTR_LSTR002405 [Laodelphax striatellus]|uniref:Uncharacterized protein n=1 Tax=Laodelphax striatellus TaxID=195883 RepID=A0A482X2W7_LAOST|nr:hypothetical protein LSTR_LSTR002405 [Laodelphax striatellus]